MAIVRRVAALVTALALATRVHPAHGQLPASTAAFVLPAPTGPHAIGTTSFFVTRQTADSSPPRVLKVTAWYPTTDSARRTRAPYLREAVAVQAMVALGRNPAAAALATREVATHSWLDAPVASALPPLPVIVFSHGYLGMPSDYTALMEELASHGLAVFSIAHTGESMALSLPDGSTSMLMQAGNRLGAVPLGVIGEWGAEDSIATVVTSERDPVRAEGALRWYLSRIPNSTAALARWVDDTRAAVDEIARLANADARSPFSMRLDMTRVGALGHSMGGVTSAAYCARDSRCRAASNLDGSPQYGDLIDVPSATPMLMVYSARAGRVGVSDLVYARGADYTRAVLAGSLHLNFGDWQYWQGDARISAALGTIAPDRATTVVHRLLREYFFERLGLGRSSVLMSERPFPELELRRVRR